MLYKVLRRRLLHKRIQLDPFCAITKTHKNIVLLATQNDKRGVLKALLLSIASMS